MGKLRFGIAMTLDGSVAGKNQSTENPLGVVGDRLHEWAFDWWPGGNNTGPRVVKSAPGLTHLTYQVVK